MEKSTTRLFIVLLLGFAITFIPLAGFAQQKHEQSNSQVNVHI